MNDIRLNEFAEEQTRRLLEYYIKIRKQHKLSQSELERITGVSRISINRYESGKIMPSVRAVNQLLATMGYRLDIVPLDDNEYNEVLEEDKAIEAKVGAEEGVTELDTEITRK